MMSRRQGEQVERQVERFLEKRGLQSIARNYNAPGGEIDLIMRHQQTVVFVEVRFRNSSKYGSAAESVDYRKQQRISRTAAHFLQQHPRYQNLACRFDVVACHPDNGNKSLQMEWLSNAFDAY